MRSIILFSTMLFISIAAFPVSGSTNGSPLSIIEEKEPGNAFGLFIAHRQAKGTALMWTSSAPDVNSFDIERSYDGEFYDVIGSVPGKSASLYRFKDTDVFPGYIHYRLKAVLSDGSIVYSDVVDVRIVQRAK